VSTRVSWPLYAGLVFLILSWFYLRNPDPFGLAIGLALLGIGGALVTIGVVELRRRRAG
jgi:hypothetical protein